MAQRDKGKKAIAAGVTALERAEARALAAERDRDALAAELALARARIAELESRNGQAIDRIDRVIGSLGHLLTSDVLAAPRGN